MSPSGGHGRPYRGQAPESRSAERRARLLEAALEEYGTGSWDDSTILSLCRQARMGTRGFYQEFDNRDQLLLTLATGIMAEGIEAIRAALADAPPALEVRARLALTAYLRYVTDDPRRAQVCYRLFPSVSSLTDARHAALVGFAMLIEQESQHVDDGAHDPTPTLRIALAGAVAAVLEQWTVSTDPTPVEVLIEDLTRLYVAVLHDAGADSTTA